MADSETYSIFLTRTYYENTATLAKLFRDNTVFRLTGADVIQADFRTGGSFRLIFNNRGTIYGQFIEIAYSEFVLEWNVEGFQRPKEDKTIVEISLRQEGLKSVLTLKHKNIPDESSASVKQRAWMGILEDIEKEITA
jgi:hypothetical protein